MTEKILVEKLEKHEESELKKLKVADLQKICSEYNLEHKGLKKAELIEAILEFEKAYPEFESGGVYIINAETLESSDVNEVNSDESTILESSEDLEDKPDEAILDDSEETEELLPSILVLDNHKMLFKKPDLAYPDTKIAGKVKILGQKGIFYKVEATVNGRGTLVGYIVR